MSIAHKNTSWAEASQELNDTINSLRQTRSVYLHALRALYMCKQFHLVIDFLIVQLSGIYPKG